MGFDWESLIDTLAGFLGESSILEYIQSLLSDPQVMNRIGLMLKAVGVAAFWCCMLAIALAVLSYIFRSISLYTIAKRQGCKLSVFAWFPVLWNWVLGSIADAKEKTDAERGFAPKKRNWRHVLLWLAVLSTVLGFFTGTGNAIKTFALISAGQGGFELVWRIILVVVSFFGVSKSLGSLLRILHYICYEMLFETCSKRPVLLTVLIILFPIALPFVLFALRNREGGEKLPPRPEGPAPAGPVPEGPAPAGPAPEGPNQDRNAPNPPNWEPPMAQ